MHRISSLLPAGMEWGWSRRGSKDLSVKSFKSEQTNKKTSVSNRIISSKLMCNSYVELIIITQGIIIVLIIQ